MSELREKIARALLDSNGETDCDHCYGLALRDADAVLAVLAVLADPPESVIERSADALHKEERFLGDRECVEIAFRAAFGNNNCKEKRK